VLVPITACDFLLTAFDLDLYEPVVSNMVLDEVERTLSTDFPNLTDEAVRYRVDAMREALADQIATADPSVAPSGINAKDRHVVAAAITGEATMIVSNDRRLGNEVAAASTTLTVLTLDAFASTLWDASPDGVNAVVDALVAKRQRPPVTRAELIMALQPHLPNVVKALGE